MHSIKACALLCTLTLSFAGSGLASKASIIAESKNLKPMVTSLLAKNFLDATADLPDISPRTISYKGRAVAVSESKYYGTFHGTPLAYIRPIEIMGRAAPLENINGKHIFDLGFGSIGQLRLLASLGANVVGIEVDPLLAAIYSDPADTGEIQRATAAGTGPNGHLTLLYGHFPSDMLLREAVGKGYDIIISKNVLKRGYIHPEQEVDPRMLIHLNVSDEEFVTTVHNALNKGGLFMMYNLAPAPNQPGQPYIPWADGRCPFDRELLERMGFRVLAYDLDDHVNAHEMARALGWDDDMDLEKDLYSQYTLLVKN